MNGKHGRMRWLALLLLLLLMGMAAAEGTGLEVSVEKAQVSAYCGLPQYFVLEGIVKANSAMTAVEVEIYDRRALRTEKTVVEKTNGESFDLRNFKGKLALSSLKPGEKRLRVWVHSGEKSALALEKNFYISGWNDELAHMTDECAVSAPRGQRKNLYDGKQETFCTMNQADDVITVVIPQGRYAAAMTVNWYSAPSAFKVVFRAADDTVISTIDERNPGEMLNFYYDVDSKVRKIEVTTTDYDNYGISELHVMEKNYVSPLVQRWQPVEGKVDLMVVSTHQDDELLFFGGTIPYYAAQGKNVVVVYMADCGRSRYNEALNGLWACGLKNHPIFVGFMNDNTYYERAVELWGRETTARTLVELLRRYQPDVVVTHDVEGEYGHAQHIVTSAAVQEAVMQAQNPAVFPESYAQYGAWEVKKLYIHLYPENEIVMTAFEEPLAALDGASALDLATIAYDKHYSQVLIGKYAMETSGVRYDNRRYGLFYSAVGEDIIKEDFFENIPTRAEMD